MATIVEAVKGTMELALRMRTYALAAQAGYKADEIELIPIRDAQGNLIRYDYRGIVRLTDERARIGKMSDEEIKADVISRGITNVWQQVPEIARMKGIRAAWRSDYWGRVLPGAVQQKYSQMGIALNTVPYGTTDVVHVEYSALPWIFGSISEWIAGRMIPDIKKDIEQKYRAEVLGHSHPRTGHIFIFVKSPLVFIAAAGIAAIIMKIAIILGFTIIAVRVLEWMSAREVTSQQADITERENARLNALENYRNQVLNDPTLTSQQKENLLNQAEQSYQQAQEADKKAAEGGIPWTTIFTGAGAIIILIIIAMAMRKK